jgi:serine/threonine protein kinase
MPVIVPPKKEILRYINDDDRNYYSMGRKLGEGSFGAVYEATRHSDGKVWPPKKQYRQPRREYTLTYMPALQTVACKVQSIKDRQQAFYGKRELDVWAKASNNSTHVARLYDASYNQRSGKAYIYMELLRGGDLHDFMEDISQCPRNNKIHPFLIYHVACQVALGVSELHARTIIHRDLKTDNVLLTKKITREMNSALWQLTTQDGHVERGLEPHLDALCRILFSPGNERLAVLADFGLSRDETTAAGGPVTVVGLNWNPNYSAPEMVAYNHQSPMADVYSYGILVYALCAARFPGGKADMRPLQPTYSAVDSLIGQCVADDPLRRPTAGHLIQTLWPLKIAAMASITARVNHHKQLKQYAEGIAR